MLTAATATYGRKEFAILGRLLFSKKPEIANELIVAYLPNIIPKETEIKNVYKLLIAFCAVNDLKITDCTGYARATANNRRVFLCCIIHLYAPHLIGKKKDTDLRIKRGMVAELSKIMHLQRDTVSKLITQAIAWEGFYPEFAESVRISLAKMEDLR